MARSLRLKVFPSIASNVRGLSLSGLEFASSTLPGVQGTNYTENSSNDYLYASNLGFNVIRVPFQWERLQPTLNGVLDTTYLSYLQDNINWAKSNNLKVLLDCHNYGEYSISGINYRIGTSQVTISNFANLWSTISSYFVNESGIWGYDIMNEPNNMPIATNSTNYNTTSTWTQAAQNAINAIRTNDTNKWIVAETDNYAGVQNFFNDYTNNPSPFWTDSANKLYYSLHFYFDSNNSGSYSGVNSYWSGSGRSITYGGDTAIPVFDWAKKNNINILIGEVGIPGYDQSWMVMLNDFYNICDDYSNVGIIYFAFGDWYTSPTGVSPIDNYKVHKSQMYIIANHLGVLT